MSLPIPGWGAGEMVVRLKPKLLKMGWRKMANGRMDCFEKDFDGVTIGTIWAGNHLLLNTKLSDKEWNTRDNWPGSEKSLEARRKASDELLPLFKAFVTKNKAKWEKEVAEYEAMPTGHKVQRSEVYGI